MNWRELPKEEWWVDGCLLIDYVSGQYFIHASGNSVNESDKVNEEGCLNFFAYEVEPETVCEYTGLTDAEGKKIFEKDIIRRKIARNLLSIVGVVKYFNIGFCGFYLTLDGGHDYPIGIGENEEKVECDTVIGNVFDKE